MLAIEVDNVSKRFRRHTIQPYTTLKSALVDFLRFQRRPAGEEAFQALKNITLRVSQGQTLGIIGRNGSGKSTLLKLMAGIYRPDQGKMCVTGRVAALLELGTGFHPEFSGRENILINGIVLGLSKREVRQRFNSIVRFADLEAVVDEPVKTYSTGMYMRLGFAVAVHSDPDVLLCDEILAVGDETFQQKCADKIADLQHQGKTIILVSHALDTIERWSDEVIWLDRGVMRERGIARRVIDLYREELAAQEGQVALVEHQRVEEEIKQATVAETSNRWGSREVEIVSVRMVDVQGEERYLYHSGEQVRVVICYKVHRPVDIPVFGIAILREDDLWCYGSNTEIDGISVPPLGEMGRVEVVLDRLDLLAGTYYLNTAVHAHNGAPYDYHHRLYAFAVKSDLQDVGVFRLPHRWTITPLPLALEDQLLLANQPSQRV
jgi:ABC-type polysaccharide/polyol phosphate transport system ATPase subunit